MIYICNECVGILPKIFLQSYFKNALEPMNEFFIPIFPNYSQNIQKKDTLYISPALHIQIK